jgi:hypothetical protein
MLLAQILLASSRLRAVALSHNPLTATGASVLADALQVLTGYCRVLRGYSRVL